MLSALAGGGLTVAGLGGPLAGAALASEAPVEVTSTTPVSTPSTSPAGEPTSTEPTTTATTPPTSTAPTETSTVPQTSTTPAAETPEAPTVVLQRQQKTTVAPQSSTTATSSTAQASREAEEAKKKREKKASAANNVAGSPGSVAEAGALAAILASSQASDQALEFYRIPLFLLPIYKAAAVQYGIPWQILAAINEIETNYGTDLSVSSAGAVGWMQFMPSTWLQYGVDALDSGYADPYNPVDAVFAAARYLRAAGAATNLRAAILAYNHSEEYVESVFLRAKLISSYPKAVIATLTGLIDGRLPVTGKQIAWGPLPSASVPASTATANATAVQGTSTSEPASSGESASGASSADAATPGSTAAVSPSAAAAVTKASSGNVDPLQLVDLMSAPNASVVAVQNGRIVKIGDSRKLGKYVILRDVYGDVFTYAGLGNIAPTYSLAKAPSAPAKSPVVEVASTHDPAPSQPASAGIQSPLTLSVKTPKAPASITGAAGKASVGESAEEEASTGAGKVRLFAHPGNPDARAAAVVAKAARKARQSSAGHDIPLRKGSVVTSGTVLGHVSVPSGDRDGHIRFAIQPAGDPATVAPGPVLASWAKLQTALHPQGATATNALLGATASDVFLLSQAQLERTVLADPGITLTSCARHEVVSGAVDKRVLAVLAFLSRSGLKPTVSALRCDQARYTSTGAPSAQSLGDAVDISAINGTPIAGHQGQGSIADLTIRTLLNLPKGFVPTEIFSLMRYPSASNTQAEPQFWNRISLEFAPARTAGVLNPAAAAKVAHSARTGKAAPAPVVTTSPLSASQWSQLMTRVAALPEPTIATKPSSAAIADPKHR
jgi:membrane-bound lytic murein transglycosylase B